MKDESKNKRYGSVESTTCFSFDDLLKRVKKDIKEKYPDINNEEFHDLIYKSMKSFKLNNQTFDYMSKESNLGGKRWYVKCPECGKPCLKLYLPTQHKDREQIYKCQVCHRLKNMSVLLGASSKYKKVVKPMKQLERLRSQILKKSMTPAKAAPLLEEYERIEKELSSSPEYRLWKFQKKHGDED